MRIHLKRFLYLSYIYIEREKERERRVDVKIRILPYVIFLATVCVCTSKRFNADIVTLRRLRSDNFADKGKRAFVNIFLRFLRDKRETRGNKIRALSFHKDRREITDFNTATIADTYGQLEN